MAVNINTKLGVAVGILFALGIVVGVRIVARDDASRAHSFQEKTANLPTIQLGDLDVQAADRDRATRRTAGATRCAKAPCTVKRASAEPQRIA